MHGVRRNKELGSGLLLEIVQYTLTHVYCPQGFVTCFPLASGQNYGCHSAQASSTEVAAFRKTFHRTLVCARKCPSVVKLLALALHGLLGLNGLPCLYGPLGEFVVVDNTVVVLVGLFRHGPCGGEFAFVDDSVAVGVEEIDHILRRRVTPQLGQLGFDLLQGDEAVAVGVVVRKRRTAGDASRPSPEDHSRLFS